MTDLIEQAMGIVCMFEPVTSYQITGIRDSVGNRGAMIDINRQCEASVSCFLEPQIELPMPAILAKQILHACGWINVEITGDDDAG